MHNLPVQSAFRQSLGVIVQHFENSIPKRTFALTYKTRLPWMTPDLCQKICVKNAMYKATLSDPQNKELLVEYKKNINSLNSLLKNTEILYYSNELDINKYDASKSWKLLKHIIGKQGGNYSQKKTFSINNETLDNSKKIRNEFNNFFVSIGHNLAKDITCNVNPLIYGNSVNDSIVVPHVSVAQVRNIITSLKDSSPGWDHLFPGIGIMFNAINYLNKNCLSNLYHTYIFPYLIYCIEVGSNASHCHPLPLF